jgi:hypothetical protein
VRSAGELGGFLGLLLGASVITLFEIVDAFLYFALVKYCPSSRPQGGADRKKSMADLSGGTSSTTKSTHNAVRELRI